MAIIYDDAGDSLLEVNVNGQIQLREYTVNCVDRRMQPTPNHRAGEKVVHLISSDIPIIVCIEG